MLDLFYFLINRGYRLIFGDNYMLHVPLFLKREDTLFGAQCHFADYCLSFMPPLTGKRTLDIGCGNGTLTRYLFDNYNPSYIVAVDIVPNQIEMARKAASGPQIRFVVDDAQKLQNVGDEPFDRVICMESALHYPDKDVFLARLNAILAPGGYFLIADLLSKKDKRPGFFGRRLHLHNWSHRQYQESFAKNQLRLLSDVSLSEKLLPHLQEAYGQLAREIRRRKGFAAFLLLLIIRPVWFAYLFLLRRRFSYRLFIGTNNVLA